MEWEAGSPATRQKVDLEAGMVSKASKSTPNATATSDYVNLLSGLPVSRYRILAPEPCYRGSCASISRLHQAHNLTSAVDSIAAFTLDMGDWLAYPALYTLKNVSRAAMQSRLVYLSSRNNSALYAAAQDKLGDEVLLSAQVI